jgi:hypothetical protein
MRRELIARATYNVALELWPTEVATLFVLETNNVTCAAAEGTRATLYVPATVPRNPRRPAQRR